MELVIILLLVMVLLLQTNCYAYTARNWRQWNSFQYKIIRRPSMSYYEAVDVCRSCDAQLTSICSKEEENQLVKWLEEEWHQDYEVWIGYNRNSGSRGNWHWLDNRNCNYTNWCKSETGYREPSYRDYRARLKKQAGETRWYGSPGYVRLNGCICKKGAEKVTLPKAPIGSTTEIPASERSRTRTLNESSAKNEMEKTRVENSSWKWQTTIVILAIVLVVSLFANIILVVMVTTQTSKQKQPVTEAFNSPETNFGDDSAYTDMDCDRVDHVSSNPAAALPMAGMPNHPHYQNAIRHQNPIYQNAGFSHFQDGGLARPKFHEYSAIDNDYTSLRSESDNNRNNRQEYALLQSGESRL